MNATAKALFAAAAKACAEIDSAEDAGAKSAPTIEALMEIRHQALDAYLAAFRRLVLPLVNAAYAGDSFAKGFVKEGFMAGDDLPADRALVVARMEAVDAKRARHALRAAAEESAE